MTDDTVSRETSLNDDQHQRAVACEIARSILRTSPLISGIRATTMDVIDLASFILDGTTSLEPFVATIEQTSASVMPEPPPTNHQTLNRWSELVRFHLQHVDISDQDKQLLRGLAAWLSAYADTVESVYS